MANQFLTGISNDVLPQTAARRQFIVHDGSIVESSAAHHVKVALASKFITVEPPTYEARCHFVSFYETIYVGITYFCVRHRCHAHGKVVVVELVVDGYLQELFFNIVGIFVLRVLYHDAAQRTAVRAHIFRLGNGVGSRPYERYSQQYEYDNLIHKLRYDVVSNPSCPLAQWRRGLRACCYGANET